MKKYLKYLEFLLPILAILLIEALLFKSNYVSGTWLIGWDSTQPELNIGEHFSRNLGAIWQEYRGLGVLDGMAHAANLVHTFYIWVLTLFLKVNVVRYFFVFLMHGLGGLGIYYLVRFLFEKEVKLRKTLSAWVASIFYLFNPATIQMFYAPLELFIIHFGFLPWLLLSLLKYLETGRKKHLIFMFLVNLAAVSQAHVPTIFIVYALFVAIILAFQLLRNLKVNIKRVVPIFIVIMGVNAFWGLPYVYSAFKNANTITSSKINELSNPEIILRNEAFGDLKNVALLRGFSLDYEDWKGGGEFGYQMEFWRNWWNRTPVELAGLFLFGLAIAGIVLGLIKKERVIYPFIAIFALSILNLGARIPVVSWVRSLIWNFIPYYEEVFRFAFTKFAIIYALSFAVLFSYFLVKVFSTKLVKLISPALTIIIIAGVIWSNLPAFKGEFLYDKLKLEVPQEYFEVFEFFRQPENEGRVAILPQPSFWNWEYARWGYRGSGFIWQGISSPTLHRSFDPWSSQNESYYHEITDAIYRKDQDALQRVLTKYQIRWILLDSNIFQPGGWSEGLYFDEIKELLAKVNGVTQVESEGSLTLYETNFVGINGYIGELSSPHLYKVKDDNSYLRRVPYDWVNYVSGKGIFYPFIDLLSDRSTDVKIDADKIIWEREVSDGDTLSIPSWAREEDLVPVDLYATYRGAGEIKIRILGLFPDVKIDGEVVTEKSEGEFNFPVSGAADKLYLSFGDNNYYEIKNIGEEQYVGSLLLPFSQEIPLKIYGTSDDIYFDLYTNFEGEEVRKCWQREGRDTKADVEFSNREISLTSVDAAACLGARLPMNFSRPLLLRVALEHKSSTDTAPDTCLSREGNPSCIGVSPFYQSGSNKNWGSVATFYQIEEGGIYWLDLLSRARDETGVESSISYRNMQAMTYPLIGKTSLKLEESFAPNDALVDIKGAKKITLELPLGQRMSLAKKEIWKDNRGGEMAENCSIFGLGEVKKTLTPSGITYEALSKGVNCDHFAYLGLKGNQGYLLRLKGENKGGRPLKFIMNNHATRHNDLEDLLPKGNFDEFYTLLAGTNPKGEYTLVVETRSFGRETSVNLLSEIEFVPAPIDWISKIYIREANYQVGPSSLQINNSGKTSTFFYNVELQGEGVVELSQAYEDGWIALANFHFPFSNFQLLKHVKVNGWANGWIVENSKTQKLQNSKIYIIYWPQMLEYLGFGLLLVGLAFVTLRKDGE